MRLNEYQRLAARTIPQHTVDSPAIFSFLLGLSGENGELQEHFKKYFFHGHEISRLYIVKELGDLLWYTSAVATWGGIPLGEPSFEEYQIHANRIIPVCTKDIPIIFKLLLNLSAENGRLQEYFEEYLFTRPKYEKEFVSVRLRNILLNINGIASWGGISMEEVAHTNIEKLQDRYPKGFTYADSINRKDCNDVEGNQ